MPAYRHSQLKLLRECRHAYAETYIRGNAGLPSPSLQRGENVHHAILEAVRRIVAGAGHLDIHDIVYRTVQGTNVEYADALAVLTRFQEALGVEFDIDRKAVLHVEERLEMPIELANGEHHTYRGIPDLVERTAPKRLRISDWKTHWHPESEEEFRADQQLYRYALLASYHYPAVEEFEIVKRFVRFRNNYYSLVLAHSDLERVRLALASEIQTTREIETRGDFEPTGGSWCALCAHHATCPLIREYREALQDWLSIPDEDVARDYASLAMALDGAAARLKATLKGYLGSGAHPTGRVAVAGGEYGYGPVNHRAIGAATLREIFQRHGAAVPDELLRPDLAQLDRLRRRLPDDLVREIDRAIVVTQSSDCRFRRHPNTAAAEAAREEALLS